MKTLGCNLDTVPLAENLKKLRKEKICCKKTLQQYYIFLNGSIEPMKRTIQTCLFQKSLHWRTSLMYPSTSLLECLRKEHLNK